MKARHRTEHGIDVVRFLDGIVIHADLGTDDDNYLSHITQVLAPLRVTELEGHLYFTETFEDAVKGSIIGRSKKGDYLLTCDVRIALLIRECGRRFALVIPNKRTFDAAVRRLLK